ncbi:MAG: type II secretion system protein [Chloroflexi bacterium]|nr:type II secretion system protein [Chloroflexota bacterium]
MKSRFKKLLKGQGGFTLVEMVVVIAIMGVMAAVAVPMVNSNLSRSKERAYAADLAMIQTSMEAFYTAPNNPRFDGQRQFPIRGFNSGTALNEDRDRTGEALDPWVATDDSTALSTPLNPFRGIKGGEPMWRDGSDGDGDRTEEGLNSEKNSLASSGAGWFVNIVDLQGTEYAVDTRDYFMDFTKLVDQGLLKKVPNSASVDNTGGAAGGSYSWYVDANGNVNSLNFHFPTNGLNFDLSPTENPDADGNIPGDNRGFVDGVYP